MPFAQYRSGGRSSRWGSASREPKNSMESLQNSISNATKRIEDSGYSVEDADKRNAFEKLTNLPQGQNWFFDTLDLLGRPGQAVLNVLDSAGKRTNPLTAAWKGFSGQNRVRGTDLAETLGVENPIAKFSVGTALDIGTDPLSYVPGGVLLKGAKGAGKIAAAPVKLGYKGLEAVAPSLKSAREDVIEPALGAAKDRLGYMFNPDYKATETLTGGQSDALVKAFNKTENERKFLQEEYARNLVDTAKTTGLDAGELVGREMERGLRQVDEAGKPLPRVERPSTTDQKIINAAESLMRSNAEIRELASTNGIGISELEGYMTHILSKEERTLRKRAKPNSIDSRFLGTNQPNKSILNERKLKGSVEDINENLGRKMFEPNAYFATAIGQKRLIDFIESVSFRRQVLNNPDFAVKYEPGMVVPKNGIVIDSNNYKFIKESGDFLEGVNQDIGGKYVVTKAAKEKLDRYKSITNDENAKAFLKAFDTAQSYWKRAALFSFPYHLRNDVGAKFNNYIAGMSAKDITKYSTQANTTVFNAMIKGKETPLYREYRQQGLGASSQSRIEYSRSGEDFEKSIEKSVREQSKTLSGKAKDRLNPLRAFETSREFGDFVDQTNRFSIYKWARDKGMSPEEAARKVKEAQFDYTNLTSFEREYMARLVPFYRWMRNNLPYQIQSFIYDPRKYMRINDVRMNAQEAAGISEENAPDYLKENFAIPVYGNDGKGKMLGLNLPLADLTRLSEPGKTTLDSVSPLVKLPAELTLNRNFYFNKPIERFEGHEKQFRIPGTDIEFGIPSKTAYAAEQLTGQIGGGFSRFLQKPDDVDQEQKFTMPTFGISSMFKDFDIDKANEFQLRRKLYDLQDLINYIEQQTGEKPRSVNEINKGSR